MDEPPAPKPGLPVQAGQRVKLTAEFIEHSSNPERQTNYRGTIKEETTPLGPDLVLVHWDGIDRLHPVLRRYLTEDDE